MKKAIRGNKQRRQRRRLWLYAEALSVVVLLIVCLVMGGKLIHRRQIAKEEAAARAEYLNAASERETASDANQVPEIQPYFQTLLAQNEDTVGLLTYADMSLYVCQGDDNEYYRTHKFDGTEDAAGMIFMDVRNSILPQSQNIILYGHNMKDGSRFGKLKRFEKYDYLSENMEIRFSTLYESRRYSVFAVFHTTTDTYSPDFFRYDIPNFASEEDFDAYVAAVKQRSLYPNLTADVQYGDSLLTLATCSSESENGLLIVVCKATGTGR